MKEFEPSQHFVLKVMKEARAYEEAKKPMFIRSQLFLSLPLARYVLSAAGILAAFANLIRIAMTVFSPVICR